MARVLIVDDSMFMRKVLGDILTKNGHQVVGEAQSGEEALTAIARSKPDLVTLDLVMPGMGGMELLRKLSREPARPRVVIVSAVGQQAEIREAMTLGAADFLVKPFDEAAVVKTVSAVVK